MKRPSIPHPWAQYFVNPENSDQCNEYGEIIVVDKENNHWEYRTDKLSIIIDRVVDTEEPLVYCVAHIRMIEEDAYFSGFGSAAEDGVTRLMPWKFCRRYKAVLGITGDNLINNEVELKGILIRNGKIYSKGNKKTDTMAFMPDLSMKIFEGGEVTADELIEMGVKDTYSFGPTLVKDGIIPEDVDKSRVNHINPRCGVGMVEPGYFIAITVDGRQKGYSRGMWMKDFAELMLEYGCTQAYNLDGGDSTAMVFLGENLNQHIGIIGLDTQRFWPDGLLWGVSESVPTLNDPIYNNGNIYVPVRTMEPTDSGGGGTETPNPTTQPTPEPTAPPTTAP